MRIGGWFPDRFATRKGSSCRLATRAKPCKRKLKPQVGTIPTLSVIEPVRSLNPGGVGGVSYNSYSRQARVEAPGKIYCQQDGSLTGVGALISKLTGSVLL